jgi:hypothetical protein
MKTVNTFNQNEYWIHRRIDPQGDPRSLGNLVASVEENLKGEQALKAYMQAAGRVLKGSCSTNPDLCCGYARISQCFTDIGFSYTATPHQRRRLSRPLCKTAKLPSNSAIFSTGQPLRSSAWSVFSLFSCISSKTKPDGSFPVPPWPVLRVAAVSCWLTSPPPTKRKATGTTWRAPSRNIFRPCSKKALSLINTQRKRLPAWCPAIRKCATSALPGEKYNETAPFLFEAS